MISFLPFFTDVPVSFADHWHVMQMSESIETSLFDGSSDDYLHYPILSYY